MSKNNRHQDRIIILTLVVLSVLLVISLKFPFKNLIPHGIVIQNSVIGGASYGEAKQELEHHNQDLLETEVNLQFDNLPKQTTYKNLGITFDSKATLAQINKFYSSDDPIDNYGAQISGIFREIELPPIYNVDQNQLKKEIISLYPDLMGAVNAQVLVDKVKNISVVDHQDGLAANFEKLEMDLLENLHGDLNEDRAIQIHGFKEYATYTGESAQKDAQMLDDLSQQPIRFYFEFGPEYTYEFNTTVQPDWIKIHKTEYEYEIQGIEHFIRTEIAEDFEKPAQDATIKELPPEGEFQAVVEGIAKNGRIINYQEVAEKVLYGLENNKFDFELTHQIVPGKIINQTGKDLGKLEHISEGKSGFWGSGIGRQINIRKGLNEEITNILIAPGQEFSFLNYIGEVDLSKGWALAYAIFMADELIPVPGGGLCQVSTTMYRAVLKANLEILERSTHTLYIYYYEEFGNGLDAAVYPGTKDFRFRNNTDDYIFIQAYTEDYYGFVQIYGEQEESVELIGPIYSGKVPEEYQEHLDPDWNEISWVKIVTNANGEKFEEYMTSKYKTAPRKMYGFEE